MSLKTRLLICVVCLASACTEKSLTTDSPTYEASGEGYRLEITPQTGLPTASGHSVGPGFWQFKQQDLLVLLKEIKPANTVVLFLGYPPRGQYLDFTFRAEKGVEVPADTLFGHVAQALGLRLEVTDTVLAGKRLLVADSSLLNAHRHTNQQGVLGSSTETAEEWIETGATLHQLATKMDKKYGIPVVTGASDGHTYRFAFKNAPIAELQGPLLAEYGLAMADTLVPAKAYVFSAK